MCECTHLTDFNVLADGTAEFVDDLIAVSAEDMLPQFTPLSLADLNYVTWGNLMRSPEPLIVVCLLWGFWLMLLPCLYKSDFKRRKRFRQDFVYDVDETFMQPEVLWTYSAVRYGTVQGSSKQYGSEHANKHNNNKN